MKHVYLSVFFIICSFTLSAQDEYWQRVYTSVAGTSNEVNSFLFEKDLTFVSVSGRNIFEDTYFLELNKNSTLPFVGSPFHGHYIYATEVQNNGSPFSLAVQRSGSSDNKIYLNTFTDDMLLEEAFELDVALEANDSKGPALIQENDTDLIIFGNNFFYQVTIAGDGTMSLSETKAADYGLIADAKAYNGGYILCNEAGKLIHVDENLEEVWEKDLGNPLNAIIVLSDGFLIAGSIDDESALIKTNFSGSVDWEMKYGEGMAVDLDFSNENGYVFTGQNADNEAYVIKTDVQGDIIWDQAYTSGTGSRVIKSKYGGYLMQSRFNFNTSVFRIAEDGSTGDLTIGLEAKKIEANNISTSATATGQLFWDGDNVNTTFPKDAATTTIFAGGLWMAGVDQNGDLHAAASSYTQSDFQPGPIELDPLNVSEWNRVWRITKQQINRLRDDSSDGSLDNAYPLDLWTYPGAGNPNFNILESGGSVLEVMAPFVDVNNDGIYNILDGDYPEIKGDDMIWWIMSSREVGVFSGGVPLGVEVMGSLYAYECSQNQLLYNTAFLDFEIVNRSEDDYIDLRIGTFIDFDIGCFLDDYIGTIPPTNSGIGYNRSATDGVNGQCNGVDPFNTEAVPIQSVTYLNSNMEHSMYFNNLGANNPPPQTGTPRTPTELQRVLEGKWLDGTPLTEGGSGYGGIEEVDYAFPGNPSNTDEWSMCSTTPADFDRRLVIATDSKTLTVDEELDISLGLLVHENINYPCPDIFGVQSEIQMLQDMYDTGNLGYDLYLGPDLDFMEGDMITLDAGMGATSYNWSTGEMTSSIEINSAGIYSVTVTTMGGCEYTDEINVGGVVGLAEVQRQAPKIYPNPSSHQLFVELGEEIPNYISIENTLGQNVQMLQVAANDQYSTLELNVGQLSQGLYLVRFHFDNTEKTLLRKLIIAK